MNESTVYFAGEGHEYMQECIEKSADWCATKKISTLVIFTGTGAGPHYAAKELLPRQRFKDLRVVAVTPPHGRSYRQNPADPNSPIISSGISPGLRDQLVAFGIQVVSAHFPFKDIAAESPRPTDWSRAAEAFGILGGGFSYCVQAILLACDAGALAHGERVVALSADTAFEATACRTESFVSGLDGMLVGHIICRPGRYTISKQFHETVFEPSTPDPPPALEPSQQTVVDTTFEPLSERSR